MNIRALIIGLEFVEPLFSGNGILTHSVVLGMLSQGYDVTVLCAKPVTDAEMRRKDDQISVTSNSPQYERKNLNVITVQVPEKKWRRLDRNSAWEELARYSPDVVRSRSDCFSFNFNFIFGIDWSAAATYQALKSNGLIDPSTAYVNLVFRVFSSSKELMKQEDDELFYKESEINAMSLAQLTVALSHVDRGELIKLLEHHTDVVPGTAKNIHILIPPLRDDFHKVITQTQPSSSSQSDSKRYLLCNVRLSPEKNVIQFALLMKELSNRGLLKKWNVTPLLIGSVCDKEYAEQVQALLPPETEVVNKFLKPDEIYSYLQQTVLLIHPPVYEAYGMVIAEAAAAGVPSLIHQYSIGVSSLLSCERGEIFCTDMSSLANTTRSLIDIMSDDEYLEKVRQSAQSKSLQWTTNDYGSTLTKLISQNDFEFS